MNVRRFASRAALGALGLALWLGGAQAQDTYPDRPIRIVIGLAAGGPIDSLGRSLAEPFSAALGQKMVIENVVGAGGSIAHSQVARADPDGYTLLLTHVAMATAGSLNKNLSYDPQKSFTPIGLVTDFPTILVARPGLPVKDPAAALQYLRDNSDKISFGHAGIGSTTHLCALLVMESLGLKFNLIPYKGAGPALVDLLADRVDFMCDGPTPATKDNVASGRVKAVATLKKDRLKTLPNVPTSYELGLKNLELNNPQIVYVPAGTPEPIVAKLVAALRTALKDQNLLRRFDDLGCIAPPEEAISPKAAAARLASEIKLWEPILRKNVEQQK